MVFNTFKSDIFPIPPTDGIGIKTLTQKPILQRLPIALTKGKAGITSKS